MRRLAAAAVAAAGLTACGTPSADLFVVERDGSIPGARLTLRVSDGGWVTCNGGPQREMPQGALLDARALARDLQPVLARDLRLPPRGESILRYSVEGDGGVARFADTSAGQPHVLRRTAAFTRNMARRACGLAR